jgi:hypothetical protein
MLLYVRPYVTVSVRLRYSIAFYADVLNVRTSLRGSDTLSTRGLSCVPAGLHPLVGH